MRPLPVRVGLLSRSGVPAFVAMVLVSVPLATTALAQAPRQPAGDALTPRLELMLRSMRIARDWHVGKPERPELIAGAIDGLLARVDPEAELYTPQDLRRIARFAVTATADVGLELRREPKVRRQASRGYRIVSVRDASPAARAGLKSGDLVTHIDGRAAGDMTYMAVTRLELPGKPGSRVRLTVERAGDEPAQDIELERTEAVVASLHVDLPAPAVARVRFPRLDMAGAELTSRLRALEATAAAPLKGVVVDLRSTSEGTPEAVGDLADAFLEKGPVLRIAARRKPASTFMAAPGAVAEGRPLVVLVDGGTAGPAEALAAALVQRRGARVVGTTSAGRPLVRSLLALGARGEKGALRMATGRLVTPDGTALDPKGLAPAVVVEQTPASSMCRSIDIADAAEAGRCRPRTIAEDGQLARALALLDEAVVAAKSTPASARP
ncbi:MAG: S41 family peptidase [Hyphomicrobiaceae bacterium]